MWSLIQLLVLAIAIVWVATILLIIRSQLRRGDVIVLPMFTSTVLFALGIAVVISFGLSSLHLLWWFPISGVLGIGLLVFPSGVHLTMSAMALLAGPIRPRKTSAEPR